MKKAFFYQTPLGTVGIAERGGSITDLMFGGPSPRAGEFTEEQTPLIKEAHRQLCEYFEGKRKEFDVPLDPQGTEFQKKVWKALCEIPYGKTRSYGEVALRIGNPKASRAVGMANNRNPIAIFIPCHRVVGSTGKLVGYAGGMDTKKHLLRLEGASDECKI